jgi:proline iminopeptidase
LAEQPLDNTASGEERSRLWQEMARIWPAYDSYQSKTDRQIPVVVIEPSRVDR